MCHRHEAPPATGGCSGLRPPAQCLTHQAVSMSSSMSCQSAAGAADEVFRRTSRQRKQPTRSSLRIPWRTFIHVQWRRARRWSTILRWESKVLSAFAWHARSADRVKDAMFRERTELPQPDDADGTYDHGQWTATGNSMVALVVVAATVVATARRTNSGRTSQLPTVPVTTGKDS